MYKMRCTYLKDSNYSYITITSLAAIINRALTKYFILIVDLL